MEALDGLDRVFESFEGAEEFAFEVDGRLVPR